MQEYTASQQAYSQVDAESSSSEEDDEEGVDIVHVGGVGGEEAEDQERGPDYDEANVRPHPPDG